MNRNINFVTPAVITTLLLFTHPAFSAPANGLTVVAQASTGDDKGKPEHKKRNEKGRPGQTKSEATPSAPATATPQQPKKPLPPPAATRQPPPAATHTKPPQPPTAAKPTSPTPPTAARPVTQPPPAAAQSTPSLQPRQAMPPAAPSNGRMPGPGQRQPAATATPAQPAPLQNQQAAPIAVAPPTATPSNVRRLEDFRNKRREVRHGNSVIIQEPGRTIIRDGGQLVIQRNESERFRANARNVRTERRGNDLFTIIERPNGIRIIDVTDANGRLLRRIRRDARGHEVVLIDNSRRHGSAVGAAAVGAAAIAGLVILNMASPVVHIPRDRYIVESYRADRALIYETLMAPPVVIIDRPYSLDEIRYNAPLRERMRRIDIDTITFETGSWEVMPDQAARLQIIADAMLQAIRRNPAEIFMIEGHTDAIGSDIDNLSLSDRRAESVAQLLSEQFGVPPENLTTQGYGERYLKIPTNGPERRNRRVTVLRITPLLNGPVARNR